MKNIEEIAEAIRQLLREENKSVENLIMSGYGETEEQGKLRQAKIDKIYSDIHRLEAAKTVLTIS